MKYKILKPTGDAYKVMFKTDEDVYLFTIAISGTQQKVWKLDTPSKLLDATLRLAGRIGSQSSTANNKKEMYLFTSYNSEDNLAKTIENL